VKVGVLVLAAGFSRRFNGDKRLFQPEGDKALLQMTIENVLAANLPCRVCIRPEDQEVAKLLVALNVDPICCVDAHEGMGATLAEGARAISDWDGVLVALGDMAWVDPATYRKLAEVLVSAAIVQPAQGGRPGNPVGFSSPYYPQLSGLTGDEGGRSILRQNAQVVVSVDVPDPGIHRDLDYIS
jgi:molybdenum cofactor cytidylyltransferase